MKNKENIYNPEIPETPAKNPALKYILLAVLIVATTGTWAWQCNPKQSKDTTSFNVDSAEPDMVTVQGGKFAMGSNMNTDEKPIHEVTLSSFKIAKYETTVALWQKVMGYNPVGDTDCMDCPVTSVSWDDIQRFIQKLNALTGKHYRLPTEAEWEFAARGGTKSKNFEYAGSNDSNEVAWTSANSGLTIHPVGQKKPNELGLYDMSGNAWEWCTDWFDENYYAKSPGNDPKGPESGPFRIVRGSNFHNKPADSRVAYRPAGKIGYRWIGFRLTSSF